MSGAIGGRGAAGPQGPAGPVGPQGPKGDPGLMDISIGEVITGQPDTPAEASIDQVEPGVFLLNLVIPKGADGDADVHLEVGSVETLEPDQPAYIRFVGMQPVGFDMRVGKVTPLPPGSQATVTIEKE